MKTQRLSVMQKHTFDGLAFCATETRQAAVLESQSLTVRNNLVGYLAGFVLMVAAVGCRIKNPVDISQRCGLAQ